MQEPAPDNGRGRWKLVVKLALLAFLLFGLAMCGYAMSQYG